MVNSWSSPHQPWQMAAADTTRCSFSSARCIASSSLVSWPRMLSQWQTEPSRRWVSGQTACWTACWASMLSDYCWEVCDNTVRSNVFPQSWVQTRWPCRMIMWHGVHPDHSVIEHGCCWRGQCMSRQLASEALSSNAVRIVFFHFESNNYRWSQKSPVVSTC